MTPKRRSPRVSKRSPSGEAKDQKKKPGREQQKERAHLKTSEWIGFLFEAGTRKSCRPHKLARNQPKAPAKVILRRRTAARASDRRDRHGLNNSRIGDPQTIRRTKQRATKSPSQVSMAHPYRCNLRHRRHSRIRPPYSHAGLKRANARPASETNARSAPSIRPSASSSRQSLSATPVLERPRAFARSTHARSAFYVEADRGKRDETRPQIRRICDRDCDGRRVQLRR